MQAKILNDAEDKSKKARQRNLHFVVICKSSAIINNGKRGKRVLKQILGCKVCCRQFRKQEVAFAKLQSDSRMIPQILSMHCRNVSSRGTLLNIETYGIKPRRKPITIT